MGALGRAHQIPIIGAFIQSTEEIKRYNPERHPVLRGFAEESGFNIVTMEGTYKGVSEEAVQLAPWDTHLNGKGHEIVADKLYKVLVEHDALLNLGLSQSTISENTRP